MRLAVRIRDLRRAIDIAAPTLSRCPRAISESLFLAAGRRLKWLRSPRGVNLRFASVQNVFHIGRPEKPRLAFDLIERSPHIAASIGCDDAAHDAAGRTLAREIATGSAPKRGSRADVARFELCQFAPSLRSLWRRRPWRFFLLSSFLTDEAPRSLPRSRAAF